MKISVIIPTLQEANNIGRLVAYIKTQGHTHIQEIIVVDGGSTDDTVAIATSAGALVLEIGMASRAAQMNAGAAKARAEILYFVHADSIPPDSFAEDILKEIKVGYPMGCFRYVFDSPRKILKFNAWFVRFKWLWCQGGDKTFFILKDTFHALGAYDTNYVVMEEYDFLRRAMKQFPLRIIPKNVISSARKYERNSWLRVQIANATAFTMFRMGMDSRRIRDTYKRMLH